MLRLGYRSDCRLNHLPELSDNFLSWISILCFDPVLYFLCDLEVPLLFLHLFP